MLIIPQHNRADLTRACIDSLRLHEAADVRILIVDDHSLPEEREMLAPLAEHDPHLALLDSPATGPTAAWNFAATAAQSEFLIFLNNDVICRGPFLNALLQPLIDGAAVAAGVQLRRERALPKHVLRRLPARDLLEGWCLAVKAGDFFAVGGFDESLPLYFSDTDLQLRLLQHAAPHRARLQAQPHLLLQHLGRQSTRHLKDRKKQWRRDRATFIRKWTSHSKPAQAHQEKPEAQAKEIRLQEHT